MIIDGRRRFMLFLGDLVLLALVGIAIRTGLAPNLGWGKLAVSLAVFPPVFYITGLYERKDLPFDGHYLAQAATAGAITFGALAVIFYWVPPLALPRRLPLVEIVAVLAALPFYRKVSGHVIGRVNGPVRLIIHGSGPAAEALEAAIREHGDYVVEEPDAPFRGGGNGRNGAPAVVADVSNGAYAGDSSELLGLARQGYHVVDMVNVYERATGRLPTEHLSPQWLLSELQPIRGPAFQRIRRVTDVLGALVLLAVLGIPTFRLGVLLWLEDRGPILYKQRRVGLDEREFTVYKLRTMRVGADSDGPLWTVADDHRVTRVGRIARWLRLDEVPQLLNVLKGDMSLVGPRPEAVGLVRQYEEAIPNYHLRHLVKPGVTGWAQVCFENTSSVDAVRKKLEYDLYYIRHMGPVFDLRIMLRTVAVVLSGKGSR
ncbi:MAG: sugar transferase [Gemmatimonadota bacterium]